LKRELEIANWDQTKFLASFAEIHGHSAQQKLDLSLEVLYSLAPDKRFAHVVEQLNIGGVSWRIDEWQRMFHVFKANMLSTINYTPQMNEDIPTTLLRASEVGILDILPSESESEADPSWGWHDLAGDSVEIKFVPGNHFTMLTHPHVQSLANTLSESLDKPTSEPSLIVLKDK
jgi:thioesterase domain-containing protein